MIHFVSRRLKQSFGEVNHELNTTLPILDQRSFIRLELSLPARQGLIYLPGIGTRNKKNCLQPRPHTTRPVGFTSPDNTRRRRHHHAATAFVPSALFEFEAEPEKPHATESPGGAIRTASPRTAQLCLCALAQIPTTTRTTKENGHLPRALPMLAPKKSAAPFRRPPLSTPPP